MGECVVIVGAFHEILELAEECGCRIVGLIDDHSKTNEFGYPLICSDETVTDFIDQLIQSGLILTPDLPAVRQKLYLYYSSLGFRFPTLISPNAKISKFAAIEEGVIMQSGSHLSAGSKLGRFVKLNVNANVMHDSSIGDFSTIAPDAVILGRVKVGNLCYIGSNSTILPGIRIGNRSVVGAGAVVTKDVPDHCVVAGNPARVFQ